MRKIRFQAVLALLLIFCMLLSSCSWFKDSDEDNNDEEANVECQHENAVLRNEKSATCATEGYTGDLYCPKCDKIITPGEKIDPVDHVYDEGVVTKEPTCIEEGIKTFTCTLCNEDKKLVPVEKVPHSDEYHILSSTEHQYTCLVCDINENQAHTPTDSGRQVAATCLEAAYTEYTCALCEGIYKVYSETDTALGDHEMSDWTTTASSCSDDGEKTRRCTRTGCNHVDTIIVPAASGHFYRFSEYITAPDCENDGLAIYACQCGDTKEETVAKTGIHKYGAAQTGANGFVTKECEVCGYSLFSYNATDSVSATVATNAINSDRALEMSMKEAAIEFPAEVVSQITSGTNVTVSADVLDSSAKENAMSSVTDEEQRAALENAPIYDFTVRVDNQIFSDNFSERVAITLSYELGDNDADGIVIYYLAENGEIEAITDVVYNEETGEVSFFVEHFSFYAVAYAETQAMKCSRGNHTFEAVSSQTATCYRFGYTTFECICCHQTSLDYIVEKLEHNYGSIQPAAPTCESSDYSKRICHNEGCGDVLLIEESPAIGHEMDHPATCTEPSRCTNEGCGKILVNALGHSFTDWEIITPPTSVSEGLRRRSCTRCDEVQTSTISSAGNVEAIEYDGYTELVNALLGEFFAISSGEFEIALDYDSTKTLSASVKIAETESGYRMIISGRVIYYYDTYRDFISWTDDFEFYYDNGAFIVIEDGYDASVSDIDAAIPMAFELFEAIAAELYSCLDECANEYLGEIRAFVDEYRELCADELDAILATAGLPYSFESIDSLVNSIETVYAYLSTRLGFETMAQIREEISVPSTEDIVTVLGVFLTPVQNETITTYTFTLEPICQLSGEIADYIAERLNDTLADFIYGAIGSAAIEYNESFTNFNSIIDYIAQIFPGTLTVADAVDMYIAFIEASEITSLDRTYAIMDKLVLDLTGNQISFEETVAENSDVTLDELAAIIFENEEITLLDIYDNVKAYAAETLLGNVEINEFTVSDLESKLREISNTNASLGLSFSVNEDGELVGINVSRDFWNAIDSGHLESSINIDSFNLSINRDESITVDIPTEIAPLLRDVNFYYDADGNLIIEGLDPLVDYNVSIVGNGIITLDDIVIKDEDFSNRFGFDVYVLDERYWTDTQEIGTYIYYDGNYYLSDVSYYTYVEPTSAAVWSEFANRLYDIADNPGRAIGYLLGTSTPVYSFNLVDTEIAIFYQKDGEWTVSTRYSYVQTDEESGYYVTDEFAFDDFVRTIRVGMATQSYAYDYALIDGVYYDLLTVNVAYGTEGRTAQLKGIEINDNLQIITSYYTSGMNVFNFTSPLHSLPIHSFTEEQNITAAHFNSDGTITWVNAQQLVLYNNVPSYYIRVTDGVYSLLDSRYVYTSFNTEEFEELLLPDGNTLYIIGSTTNNEYGYTYGYETFYGYATTSSGVYIQAAAFVFENEVVEVRYRDTADNKIADFSSMFDINEYITVGSDGTYTVSSELINELKRYCMSDNSSFAFRISYLEYIAGMNVEIKYNVGAFSPITDIDIEDIFGEESTEDSFEFWKNLFGNIGENSVDYTITQNDDGSITVTFDYGTEISNITYSANSRIPAESVMEKNEALSESNGVEIFSYESNYTSSNYPRYVYLNGKYYDYSLSSNYDFTLEDDIVYTTGWDVSGTRPYYISNSSEQYKLIGAPGIPDGTPVYNTRIVFDFENIYGYYPQITLYTFFVDSVLNVAVQAEAIANSLLVFESYMPMDEYMRNLRFEFSDSSSSNEIYYRGELTPLYTSTAHIFETDGSGNKLDNRAKYSIDVNYIMQDGNKKYIRAFRYLKDIMNVYSSEADLSYIPEDATATRTTRTYYNGTFTMVEFFYQTIESKLHHFVKLANRYYRYNVVNDSYIDVRITEDEFYNQNLDYVWFFKCEDASTGQITYSTEFIPSDDGFVLSGDPVDINNIEGDYKGSTLLGYTADGSPIYEVLYMLTTEADHDWTEEVQSDGTVFLHKDGVGYLRVTQNGVNYYVRARKVAMPDGTDEIYCSIVEAVIYGSEIAENRNPFLEDYISANGRELTIKPELLQLITGGNKNFFNMNVHLSDPNDVWSTTISYYQIESFFMLND